MVKVSWRKPKIPNLKRYHAIRRQFEQELFELVNWVDSNEINISGNWYNMVDFFSGSGGLTLGFVQAGYRPLLGVEADPAASATFRQNFPRAIHWEGRVENASAEMILDLLEGQQVHVICAGFPCPGFSVAGQRDIEDRRNTLYKEVVRLTQAIQPLFVVLENVPGFVTLAQGKYLSDLRRDFLKIGYKISAQVLESASYGVPQMRPRTILIGNKFGVRNPYPKPILSEDKYVPIEAAIDDLKTVQANPKINHEWTKHSNEMTKRISQVPPGGSLYDSYMDAWKRQYKGVPAMTIKENHGGTHIHPDLNRVLSAREMARLQTFPDSFFFWGTMKRVYFQVGNAVPPLLAKHIALALRPSLEKIPSGLS